MSSGLRRPNGSQISDGMNVKWSCGSSTTTSWRSSRCLRSSRAAVSPAKLEPTITTRCGAEGREDMGGNSFGQCLGLAVQLHGCRDDSSVPYQLVKYTTVELC